MVNGTWQRVQTLTASDGTLDDGFGKTLAVDQGRLVVGAVLEAEVAQSRGEEAVYVFELQNGTWSQTAKILPTAENRLFDEFGTGVSLSGDRLAVGAPNGTGQAHQGGVVYLFTKTDQGWEQTDAISFEELEFQERFGASVAIKNDLLVIGSTDKFFSAYSKGRAYFLKLDQDWNSVGTRFYDTSQYTMFKSVEGYGASVAIAEDWAIIGAPFGRNSDNGDKTGTTFFLEFDSQRTVTADLEMTILPVNDAPVIETQTFNIDEYLPNSTVVGTVTASDPVEGDSIVSFAITDGNTDGAFAIDNNGQITVANQESVNYLINSQHKFTLTISATDDGNPVAATGSGTVEITLNQVNNYPRVYDTNLTVPESAQNGDVLAEVRWYDQDGDNISSYEIVPWNGTTINPFLIDTNGTISVADASPLSFGTKYYFIVRATDDGGPPRTGGGIYEITVVGDSFYQYESLNSSSLNTPDLELGQSGVTQITDTGSGSRIPLLRSGAQQHSFNFGGTTFTQTQQFNVPPIIVHRDYGLITFEDNFSGSLQPDGDENDLLDHPPPATIAPYWSNLNENMNAADAVLYKFEDFDNNGNMDLIIEWSQVSAFFQSGNGISFQLILELDTGLEPGQIWFNYKDLDDGTGTDGAWYNEGARAAVGLKDSNPVNDRRVLVHSAWTYPHNADQFTPNPEVQSGKAIRFFIPPPPNEPPSIEDATFTIAENSPFGTSVGTVVASDPNVRDTLSYSITAGNTGNAFSISTSGVITVANSAALDFETTSQFQLTVQVLDDGTGNLTDTATVTIDLTDVFEPPFYVATPAPFIDLDTLDLATDPQASLLTSASNADDFAEAIDLGSNVFRFGGQNYTGEDQLYVSTNGTISLGSSFSDYSNSNFSGSNIPLIAPFWDDLRTDIGGPPDDQIFYRIFDYDNDGNDELLIQWNETRYYGSPFDNTNGITFQAILDLNTGTTPANILFNYHDFDDGTQGAQNQGATVLAGLKYGNGNPADSLIIHSPSSPDTSLFGEGKAILLEVPINDPPEIDDQTFSIAENAAAEATIGTIAFSDPDPGDTVSLALSNLPSLFPFDVDLQTGEITLKQDQSLNFEQTTQYTFTATATDSEDETAEAQITIDVTDVNEVPSMPSLSVNQFAENLPASTVVGTLSSVDPENTTITYSLVSGDGDTSNDLFTIDGNELKSASLIDFEQVQVASLRIRATDAGNAYSEARFTLFINDRNDTPTITAQSFSVPENPSVDAVIGTVSASDEDFGQTLSYAILSGNDAGDLRIDNNGQLLVVDPAAFDFEASPSWTLQVEVSDSFNPAAKASATITVNVTDVNEAPGFDITQTATEVVENTLLESELKIADVVLDDDALGINTHWLTGTDASHFELRNTTLYLRAGTELDFESNPVLDVTINLDDSHLTPQIDFQQSLTVTIADVNEAPTLVLQNTTSTLAEDFDTTIRTRVADIAVTDDALGTNVLSLTGSDAALFEIDGTELFLVAGATLDFESNPVLDVIVEVDDTSVGSTPDDTAELSVSVTERPKVTVSVIPGSIDEDGGAATATITRNTPVAESLDVALSGNAGGRIAFPGNVTIPAGSNFVDVTINAVDNAFVDGDATFTVTASSSGFSDGNASLTVVDDDTPLLTITPGHSSVGEQAGAAATTALVTRNFAIGEALPVQVRSSDVSELTVSGNATAEIVIPANQTSFSVNLDSIDDLIVDGTQTVSIEAEVTSGSHVGVGGVAAHIVDVTDDDVPMLTLVIDQSSISENGGVTTATVTRNTDPFEALTFSVVSDDTSEAVVPASLDIPAGQISATFNVEAVDDDIPDGTQTVAITVSSLGFVNGRQTLDVTDDGLPDLVSVSFDATDDIVNGASSEIAFVVENSGEFPAGAFQTHVVWSPNDIPGDSDDVVIVDSVASFTGLGVGASESRTISISLDRAALYAHAIASTDPGHRVGTVAGSVSHLHLIIDPANEIAEISGANNFGRGHQIDSDDITYFPWDKDGNGVVSPRETLSTILAVGTADSASDFDGNGVVTPLEALGSLQRIGYRRK